MDCRVIGEPEATPSFGRLCPAMTDDIMTDDIKAPFGIASEAKQSKRAASKSGLLTWGMCVSRMSSHLFVRLRPPLRPDRGLCRMARADQVKAGPLGPPRSGLALS